MYYYLFSYSGYDYKEEYSLIHREDYSDEKFSEIIDTACQEVAKLMMPDQLKKKKDMAKYYKADITKKKKQGNNNESLAWNIKWYGSHCKETNLTISIAANTLINHLVTEYGFERVTYTASQSFDEDYSIGKIPAVPFLIKKKKK